MHRSYLANEPAGLTTMTYDWENRLQLQTGPGLTVSYAYYTDNMKAIENVGGAVMTLIWDGTNYLQGRF